MVLRLLYVLLACLLMSNVWAQANDLVAVNSISKTSDGNYLLGSNDPYFVFRHSSNNGSIDSSDKQKASLEDKDRYWLAPIQLLNTPGQNRRIEIEVFFDGEQAGKQHVFSPTNYLRYAVDAQNWSKLNGLNIKLPRGVQFNEDSLLRLDVAGCSGCKLAIKANPNLDKARSASYANTELLQQRNGVAEIGQELISIEPEKWSRNDINNKAKVTGIDPFMISPLLDLSTSNLAGIYFEAFSQEKALSQNKATKPALFQLFYASESHGFIEAASVYAQVHPDNNGDSNEQSSDIQNSYRFFLPLDFLAEQSPRRELLERVRLDFSTQAGSWALTNVELVPESKRSNYQSFLPKLRVQSKLQNANGRQILANIVSRLGRDLGFLFFYLLLLSATAYFIWRGFRDTNKRDMNKNI